MSQRPYKDFYIATTGELASSGGTEDLAVGQIGFFSGKTWQVTTAPTFQTAKTLVVAQGTPDLSGMPEGAGIPNTSFKVTIDAQKGKILDWYVKKSQRPQNMIVRLGFDGVDTTKTLTAKPGETKQVWLKLSGQPINNFYPDVPAGLKIMLPIEMPCADECSDSCTDVVDCNIIADLIIDAVNNYKIIGGQPLSKYVRASKVVSCGTPSGYPTQAWEKYCLTVLDDGTPRSLAAVQAQYPGLNVQRTNRIDAYSTYEFTQIASEPAPADFVTSELTVIPNCDVCPSGYTLQDAVFVYAVTLVDDGDGTALTTFRASYGSTAVRILFENGVSTYLAYSATETPSWTPIAGATQIFIGEQRAVCTLDGDGVEVAWTLCDTGTKALKTWELTLKNDPCEDCDFSELLAELQEAMTGVGTVTLFESNCTFCTAKFRLVAPSDNPIFPDCGDGDVYKFSRPPAFNNQKWVEAVVDVTGEDCACGVEFTSAYYDPKRDACTFEGFPYFSDPLYIEVSQHDSSSLSSPCADDWAVTTVQNIKFPSGYGQLVSDFERKSKYYRNVFYNVDPVVRRYKNYN